MAKSKVKASMYSMLSFIEEGGKCLMYTCTHTDTHMQIFVFLKIGSIDSGYLWQKKKEESEADFSQYTSVYRFDFKNDVYHIYIYKVKFLRSNL